MVQVEGERVSMTSISSAENGSRVPVLTRKEAEENINMFPPDVQRRIEEELKKFRK